jgi:hypothetical protein
MLTNPAIVGHDEPCAIHSTQVSFEIRYVGGAKPDRTQISGSSLYQLPMALRASARMRAYCSGWPVS